MKKKEDSLTASIARLHRAGSIYSQQNAKLRQAVDDLIGWLCQNLPHGFVLPFDCYVWPSGDFAQMRVVDPKKPLVDNPQIFKVSRGGPHSLHDLLLFSQLISDGFIDQLSIRLEEQAGKFANTSQTVVFFTQAKP